jgi:hypothetical protein
MLTAIHYTEVVTGCYVLYAFHGTMNVMYATTTMEIQILFHFTSGWKKSAFTKCDWMMIMIL